MRSGLELSTTELRDVIADLYQENTPYLLVRGKKSFDKSGAAELFAINAKHHCHNEFSDFTPNPTLEQVIAGIWIAIQCGAKKIIAIGGGSALDVAKCILAGLKMPQLITEHSSSALPLPPPVNHDIDLILVPTTAGTGSEATHFAVVYQNQIKLSIAHQLLIPDFFVLEPQLIGSCSDYQMATSMLDALAHAIEGYWSNNSTKATRALCGAAIKKIMGVLNSNRLNKLDPQEVLTLMRAANEAGAAINHTKTSAPHAWSYALATETGLSHGHSVWLTLPTLFEIHKRESNHGDKTLAARMCELELLLGLTGSPRTELQQLCSNIGCPVDLLHLVPEQVDRQRIASKVNLERLLNNPLKITPMHESEVFILENITDR